jgi:DNA-binding CsgD family transcriptional regulator
MKGTDLGDVAVALAETRSNPASDLLDCIGTARFEGVVQNTLSSMCGAVQFASYRVRDAHVARIAGRLGEAQALQVISASGGGAASSDREDQRVSINHGMVVLRGWRGDSLIWLVVEPGARSLSHSEIASALASRSALLLAAHAKHVEVLDARDSAIRSLSSIVQIEKCLSASGVLTIREVEVCSRIIYGLSTLGIAVDLSLSEETVRTYRKRAYQRLALGTERQLLTWYLQQWTRSHARLD